MPIRYRVKRPFSYGGRHYAPGSAWEPQGLLHDDRLVRTGYVMPLAVAEAEIDATDAARHLAEEAGLDLTAVEGSGADGRIILADVRRAIQEV